MGLLPFVSRLVLPELILSATDSLCLGLLILAHSLSRAKLLSVLSHSQFEPSLPLKRCMEFLLSAPGVSCLHVHFLPVLDCIHFGSAMFPRGFASLDLFLFAPDVCRMGVPLLSRNLGHAGDLVLMQGSFRGGSLTLLGLASSGSILFSRAFVQTGAFLLVLDFASLTSSSSLQQVQRLGFLMPLVANQRVEPLLPTVMHGHLGAFALVKSASRLDSFLLAFASVWLGFSVLPKSCACVGLSLVAGALAKVGLLMFVLSLVQLGFLLPPQRVARPGLPIVVASVAALGSPLLLQRSNRCDSTVFLSGMCWVDILVLAASHIQIDALLLLRSFA